MKPRLPVSSGLFAALLSLASVPAHAEPFPVVGGYGFDWLSPATAACRQITKMDLAGFTRCTFAAEGHAFGLPYPIHRCQAPGRREYLIYASQAQCSQAFQTMQANAP